MPSSGGKWRRYWHVVAVIVLLVGIGAAVKFLYGGQHWGPVITGALSGGTALLFTNHLQRNDQSWLWRHGKSATEMVTVPVGVSTVRSAVYGEAATRKWRIRRTTDSGVVFMTPMTWRTGVRLVDLDWAPERSGTRLRLTGRIPALFDAGQTARFVRKVRDELVQACGAEDSSQDTKPV